MSCRHLAQTEATVEWAIRGLHRELPKVQQAYRGFLRQIREAHRISMVKPNTDLRAQRGPMK